MAPDPEQGPFLYALFTDPETGEWVSKKYGGRMRIKPNTPTIGKDSDGFFRGPPIGAYPRGFKAVRKKGPSTSGGPELSVCSIYGHCYCVDKTVADKAHKACCMCAHQRASDRDRFIESLRRQEHAVCNWPGHSRMVD